MSSGRIEVAGVQQDRRAVLTVRVRHDLVDVGLRAAPAERQHRDAEVAEPGLQLHHHAGLLHAEVQGRVLIAGPVEAVDVGEPAERVADVAEMPVGVDLAATVDQVREPSVPPRLRGQL